MFETDFSAMLLAHAPLSSLVGVKVNWVRNRQATAAPYVILTVVSGVRAYLYNGPSGMFPKRVQIDCYSSTFLGAQTVADVIETFLSGKSHTQGSTIFGGSFIDGDRGTFEDATTLDKLFRNSRDYFVWHKGA